MEDTLYIENLDLAHKIIERGGETSRKYACTETRKNSPGQDAERIIKKALQSGFDKYRSRGRLGFTENLWKTTNELKIHFPQSRKIVVAIPEYCTHIWELSLTKINASHLKELNLWESIGNTMEILKFSAYGGVQEEIRKIEAYCRRLKIIASVVLVLKKALHYPNAWVH